MLNAFERKSPALRSLACSSSKRSRRSMAWVSSSMLSVRSTTPASSTSSASASADETITGAPQDIAERDDMRARSRLPQLFREPFGAAVGPADIDECRVVGKVGWEQLVGGA